MNIFIYGGSNSLIKTGWTASFAPRLSGQRLINRSIGATTSLTALYRLLTDPEDVPQPGDLVIWEYALNEANHIAKGFKTEVALANGERFLRECGRRGIKVLPLIFTPQAEEMAARRMPYFDQLGQLLRHYGLATLDVSTSWRKAHGMARMPADLFRDNAHYNEESDLGRWISQEVLAAMALASVPTAVTALRCGTGPLRFQGPAQGRWFRNSKVSALVGPPDCALDLAESGLVLGIATMIHPKSASAMTVDLIRRGVSSDRLVLSTSGIATLHIPILKVYAVASATQTPWRVDPGDRLVIAPAKRPSALYCETGALARIDRLDDPPPDCFIGCLIEGDA